MAEAGPSATHCYCHTAQIVQHMFLCGSCKRLFHRGCLKSLPPTSLAGDIYFKFTCGRCAQDGQESFKRTKMHWTLVVMLALYNLQLEGSGKNGFFRWREDICRYIDRHWELFFGADRKKAATWHHTVASVLSQHANVFFVSGAEVLSEKGWWSLREQKLPTVEELDVIANTNKANRKNKATPVETPLILEGPRQRTGNVLEAAAFLKAKRAAIDDSLQLCKSKKKKQKLEDPQVKITLSKNNSYDQPYWTELPHNILPEVTVKEEPMDVSYDQISYDDDNMSFNEDDASYSTVSETSSVFPIASSASSFNESLCNIKTEKLDDSEPEMLVYHKPSMEQDKCFEGQHPDVSKKRKVVIKEEEKPIPDRTIPESQFGPMSLYDEHELLEKLEANYNVLKSDVQIANLYRKLVVRKLKRSRNVPIFDIDNFVRNAVGLEPIQVNFTNVNKIEGRQEILDRYQVTTHSMPITSYRTSSFISRLMGLEDKQLEPIFSPYTERMLMPFIFRDSEIMSPKMKVLRDIVSYPHRSNPQWKPAAMPSIDFCYVRPQHIPAINAMCQEFFWPGIDLSESLHFPDYSCVAMYKKLIIGFAFVAPDISKSETYLTFIFCHPEWRRCGIATFMLYHLTQTCAGRDMTLHVSATSPAIALYQKFGFKFEEYITNFYDKYLPVTSTECRHALYLRLNR